MSFNPSLATPTVCVECQNWNRAALQLWGQVLTLTDRLRTLMPQLPARMREAMNVQLGYLAPDPQAVNNSINYLTTGCDKVIAFTPAQMAEVNGYRAQFQSDGQRRLQFLQQDVQMAENMIAAAQSLALQAQWHNTMQGIYNQRERLIQDFETSNRELNERNLAILRGDTIVDLYLRRS
jgi:hypothetical protein